jgi:hypothetical protein
MMTTYKTLAIVVVLLVCVCVPTPAAPLSRGHIVLKSAIAVDPQQNSVVLPLYKGSVNRTTVYYIITDSSSKVQAVALGVNYAPNIGAAFSQRGSGLLTALRLSGAPNFAPVRVYMPSATGFPPEKAAPGAIGDGHYSPFVRLADGATINAPIVATGNGPFDVTLHSNTADRVLAIDVARKTVTLLLAHGFFGGSEVLYISTEASDPGVAAIERATYVKRLNESGSASQAPIVALANGQTGAGNPQAQGLAYLALDGRLGQDAVVSTSATFGSPLNVLATFSVGPSAAAYTPLWSGNVGVWTAKAVASHANDRITSAARAFVLGAQGEITSPDGKAFGPSGFVVNCPVVAFIQPIR